jgi:hypothetical protein
VAWRRGQLANQRIGNGIMAGEISKISANQYRKLAKAESMKAWRRNHQCRSAVSMSKKAAERKR